jgi:hypothetical protein
MHTEGDSWVFLTDVLSLFIGKEHVGGESTFWRVGIYESKSASLLQR